jgi:Reverse transcriptase (RNA-dependent DNA polymerase)
MIPKPGGGERLLGVSTCLDRLVQQAIAQVLTPIFDPGLSGSSFGFRPGRSAHQAVRARAAVRPRRPGMGRGHLAAYDRTGRLGAAPGQATGC